MSVMDESREPKKTILVVDDDETICISLKQELELRNYNVLLAKNGKEGLDLALKNKPDLILLDKFMPVMDGDQMVAELSKDVWGAHVPIIILTIVNDLGELNITLERQNIDYLLKSEISPPSVAQVVANRLDGSGQS